MCRCVFQTTWAQASNHCCVPTDRRPHRCTTPPEDRAARTVQREVALHHQALPHLRLVQQLQRLGGGGILQCTDALGRGVALRLQRRDLGRGGGGVRGRGVGRGLVGVGERAFGELELLLLELLLLHLQVAELHCRGVVLRAGCPQLLPLPIHRGRRRVVCVLLPSRAAHRHWHAPPARRHWRTPPAPAPARLAYLALPASRPRPALPRARARAACFLVAHHLPLPPRCGPLLFVSDISPQLAGGKVKAVWCCCGAVKAGATCRTILREMYS